MAGLEVVGDDVGARPVADDAAVVEQDRALAQLRNRLHVVRDENHRPAGRSEILHPPEAAPLELGVPDREHLVDEQDLGLEMRGDRERQPHVHPARVPLHGRVDEPLDAGELDDLGELPLDLAPLHSEHGAVQEDVLAAGQLGVESGPDLEEAAHAPADLRASRRSAS